MTKPGPTETRVRAALLRLWERHVADHVDDPEWHWLPIDVRDEVIADGQTRLQMRTIQGAGLDVSGGWYALGGGAEYTYERGVFRVRRRERPKRMDVFADRDPNPPAHLLAKPEIKNRNPLDTPDERDATIQVTWTLGRPTALVTVRAKDQDLTAPQLRSFAAALLEAAADIESDESDEPRKRAKR